MLKSIAISLILFSIIVGIVSCDEKKFVEYKPHYLTENNETRYYGDIELDSTEFANTIHVLQYYGEQFKMDNGNVIFITKELSKNWELLWNYTKKANDPEWLEAH